MKRYTITTERGIKIQVLADSLGSDDGLMFFKKKLDDGKEETVCITPATSAIEINDK